MHYRTLGKTGMNVSVLAFGASPLGNVFRDVSERECIAAVHAAIDLGINYFDVAPLYGFTLAEERLGKALAGRRGEVFVATKCGRETFTAFDYTESQVASSIDDSLKRLGTDYVDVLQIHDVEFAHSQQIINETIPAVRRAQEAGKCRFVGITGLPVRYLRELAKQIDVDTILSWGHYNLVEDELDEILAPFCRDRGIGLINASPLHQRLLTKSPPPQWHRSPQPVIDIAPRLAELCRSYDADLASVAMRFALDYPRVATTVVGMSRVHHVERNVEALEYTIPDRLLSAIRELVAPVKNMMWFEGLPQNNIPPSDPDRYVPREPPVTHVDE
jgi:L-galactose dehydrogenase